LKLQNKLDKRKTEFQVSIDQHTQLHEQFKNLFGLVQNKEFKNSMSSSTKNVPLIRISSPDSV
jgi:hypothetical protein